VGFLRSRRGLRLVAFTLLLLAACVRLGFWQLERYELRGERNDAVRASLAADPAPVQEAVDPATPPADVPREQEWRTVTVTGRYDADAQVVLRLRPLEGQAGVHVLTPLVPASGPAVLVDRGFLPATGPDAQPVVPAPPDGTVTVQGRLRLSEAGRGTGLDADSDPPSVRFVDLGPLAEQLGQPLAPVWLEATSEQPPAGDGLVPLPEPRLSSGPSLIYAVQWFLFGAIAVGGFVLLARRESTVQPDAADAELVDGASGSDRP
jgi:cytochrome oxidase assembly protein ShyY1